MDFRKFIFGETLEQALNAIPEEYQLKYYRIIKDYGLHGIEPELTGFELATWVQMKAMIDNTMPKKNNASPVCKVGAPFGNKNAQKTIKNNSENNQNNSSELNSRNNQNNSENNLQEMLNGNENVNVNENGNGNEQKQPPPYLTPFLIKKIQEEAGKLGFILDKKLAAKAVASGIEYSWFEGPFNFPVFAKERLEGDPKYRDKSSHDLVLLFVAAFGWENLHMEYPKWKQDKERQQAKQERLQALETARKNHPKKCDCGKDLEKYHESSWICRACKFQCDFDEKTLKWKWGKW
jgi:hypothetical protein